MARSGPLFTAGPAADLRAYRRYSLVALPPMVARRFFKEHLSVAVDRLADAWRAVEDRYGYTFESPDISARAVLGTALMLALESNHDRKFDRDRAVTLAAEGTCGGFFPLISTGQEDKRRTRQSGKAAKR